MSCVCARTQCVLLTYDRARSSSNELPTPYLVCKAFSIDDARWHSFDILASTYCHSDAVDCARQGLPIRPLPSRWPCLLPQILVLHVPSCFIGLYCSTPPTPALTVFCELTRLEVTHHHYFNTVSGSSFSGTFCAVSYSSQSLCTGRGIEWAFSMS